MVSDQHANAARSKILDQVANFRHSDRVDAGKGQALHEYG
jgi:hypothetical protein